MPPPPPPHSNTIIFNSRTQWVRKFGNSSMPEILVLVITNLVPRSQSVRGRSGYEIRLLRHFRPTVRTSPCHLCPEMQAMANLAILTKSCHSHNDDEFGKISSNSQINANKLNTWKPAMLVDLTIWRLS